MQGESGGQPHPLARVHCAKKLITGDQIEGTWFDRKHEHNARLRGKEPGPREFASTESVVLSQLPCRSHLEPKAYRSRTAEFFREIEETAAAERREIGKEPLGEESVLGRVSGILSPRRILRREKRYDATASWTESNLSSLTLSSSTTEAFA